MSVIGSKREREKSEEKRRERGKRETREREGGGSRERETHSVIYSSNSCDNCARSGIQVWSQEHNPGLTHYLTHLLEALSTSS